MKRLGLHWFTIVSTVIVIIVVAFAYFRNPGPTYIELDRAGAPGTDGAAVGYDTSAPARYPNGRTPADDADKTDATLGSTLPYLATPH